MRLQLIHRNIYLQGSAAPPQTGLACCCTMDITSLCAGLESKQHARNFAVSVSTLAAFNKVRYHSKIQQAATEWQNTLY